MITSLWNKLVLANAYLIQESRMKGSVSRISIHACFFVVFLACSNIAVSSEFQNHSVKNDSLYSAVESYLDTSATVVERLMKLGLDKGDIRYNYESHTKYFEAISLCPVIVPLLYSHYHILGKDCYEIVEQYRRHEKSLCYEPVEVLYFQDKASPSDPNVFVKLSEPERTIVSDESFIIVDLRMSTFYENFGCGLIILFHFKEDYILSVSFAEYCT